MLIQRMWKANPTWGSSRIVGELGKLGIDVAKSTVERYRPRRCGPPSGIAGDGQSASRLSAGFDSVIQPLVDFCLNPSNGPLSERHGFRKGTFGHMQINRTATQSGAFCYFRPSQYSMCHLLILIKRWLNNVERGLFLVRLNFDRWITRGIELH